MTPLLRAYFAAPLLSTLAACGGGGGGSSIGGGASPTNGDGWIAGVYQPSSHYAALCQNPRNGTDPVTGRAYPDSQGTTLDENNFLRSWTNELYLWYSEVPDLNPASYATTADYFPLLKTSGTTPSGAPKDKFHFTYDTSVWEQLSPAGVSVGYGAVF